MMFEDADETPLSDLIRSVYNGTDVNVDFVGGSGNFLKYIKKVPIGELVVIYFDLIPDNPGTAVAYKNLRKRLRHRANTIIIPVSGLDYYLLKAFTYDVPDMSTVIFERDYSVDSRIKSCEKYYKYLLDNMSECLSLGRFSSITPKTAIFYKEPCLCEHRTVECISLSYFEKAERIVRCLPTFFEYKTDKAVEKSDINLIISRALNTHNEIVRRASAAFGWTKQSFDMAIINPR